MLADVLAADLDYEREFYMISRKSSAGIPAAATPQALPVRSQWTEIGADFVLMGIRARDGWQADSRGPADRRPRRQRRAPGVRPDLRRVHDRRTRGSARIPSPTTCTRSSATWMASRARGSHSHPTATAETNEGAPARQDSGAEQRNPHHGLRRRRTCGAITVNKSLNIGPSWGPDGRTLAYASSYADGIRTST